MAVMPRSWTRRSLQLYVAWWANISTWQLTVILQKINEPVKVVVEYEQGKAIPSQPILIKMERVLGVKLVCTPFLPLLSPPWLLHFISLLSLCIFARSTPPISSTQHALHSLLPVPSFTRSHTHEPFYWLIFPLFSFLSSVERICLSLGPRLLKWLACILCN